MTACKIHRATASQGDHQPIFTPERATPGSPWLDGRASVELDVATRVVATGVPTTDGTIRCVMAGCGGQSSEKLSSRGVGRAITLTGTPPPDATDESLPNRPQTTFPSGPPDSVRARPPDHGVRFGCRAGVSFTWRRQRRQEWLYG